MANNTYTGSDSIRWGFPDMGPAPYEAIDYASGTSAWSDSLARIERDPISANIRPCAVCGSYPKVAACRLEDIRATELELRCHGRRERFRIADDRSISIREVLSRYSPFEREAEQLRATFPRFRGSETFEALPGTEQLRELFIESQLRAAAATPAAAPPKPKKRPMSSVISPPRIIELE